MVVPKLRHLQQIPSQAPSTTTTCLLLRRKPPNIKDDLDSKDFKIDRGERNEMIPSRVMDKCTGMIKDDDNPG